MGFADLIAGDLCGRSMRETGCRIEQTQLDQFQDIQRLLGFLTPITVRLLQLRQGVRRQPEGLAYPHVDLCALDRTG